MFHNISSLQQPKYRSAALCPVAQSCPTLCDSMDCDLPGSSVQGDYPGKTGLPCPLECVAMPSSRGCSQFRDRTQVSQVAGRFSTIWTTREVLGFDKCNLARAEMKDKTILSWGPLFLLIHSPFSQTSGFSLEYAHPREYPKLYSMTWTSFRKSVWDRELPYALFSELV